ncbi:MAG: mannose-1-phosphate guanylyltransferase [Deltaproteobacteria bacterium]|nr:mannose-1-phosphate guanylyltransferase [Deltaproteobacteria bacterium]
MTNLYLILLAGGSGTRLWPLSRKNSPKQFLKVGSEHSLVRETAIRCQPLIDFKNTFVVCTQDQSALMKNDFPELNDEQFLLEPEGKNTAAAIALAAYHLNKVDPEGIMVVLPADHKILQKEKFQQVLQEASSLAQAQEALVTLGVLPHFAATGYGYIQKGESIGKAFRVKQFKEKPDLETAEKYIKSEEYFWNSGMFVWKTSNYIHEYQQHLPHDASLFERHFPSPLGGEGQGEGSNLSALYSQLTSISVDYAILEKSKNVVVLPARFDWDDVGSLASLAKYFPRDEFENSRTGQTISKDANNNLFISDEGVVACLGVENLIVIRNKDSVLVLPKERSEEVKILLEEMKKKKMDVFL